MTDTFLTTRQALAGCAFLLALIAMAADAIAQTNPANTTADTTAKNRGSGQNKRPPPQAIAACKALKVDDVCSFHGRNGDLTGSCWAPQGKALACRPKNRAKPAQVPSVSKPQ